MATALLAILLLAAGAAAQVSDTTPPPSSSLRHSSYGGYGVLDGLFEGAPPIEGPPSAHLRNKCARPCPIG